MAIMHSIWLFSVCFLAWPSRAVSRVATRKTQLYGLSSFQFKSVISIGRCRAGCIDKFAKDMPFLTDEACNGHPDCFMCWDNCYRMDRDWETWGVMCGHENVCFTGCQVACEFFEKQGLLVPMGTTPIVWDFSPDVIMDRQVRDSYIKASWEPPKPRDEVQPRPQVVYALFWKRKGGEEWTFLKQTVEPKFNTNVGDMVLYMDSFQVLAVSSRRIIGRASYTHIKPRPPTTPVSAPILPPREKTLVESVKIIETNEESPLSLGLLVGTTVLVALLIGCLVAGGLTAAYMIYQRKRRENVVLRGRHFGVRIKHRSLRRTQPTNNYGGSNTNLLKVLNVSPEKAYGNGAFVPSRPNSASPQTGWKKQMERKNSQNSAVIAIIENGDGTEAVHVNHEAVKRALALQKSYAL